MWDDQAWPGYPVERGDDPWDAPQVDSDDYEFDDNYLDALQHDDLDEAARNREWTRTHGTFEDAPWV